MFVSALHVAISVVITCLTCTFFFLSLGAADFPSTVARLPAEWLGADEEPPAGGAQRKKSLQMPCLTTQPVLFGRIFARAGFQLKSDRQGGPRARATGGIFRMKRRTNCSGTHAWRVSDGGKPHGGSCTLEQRWVLTALALLGLVDGLGDRGHRLPIIGPGPRRQIDRAVVRCHYGWADRPLSVGTDHRPEGHSVRTLIDLAEQRPSLHHLGASVTRCLVTIPS